MDSLDHLVRNLRPGELQVIQGYYKSKFSNDNKRLQLLRLLASGKAGDNRRIAQKIYNQAPNSSLSKLKERLKEDILNFILLFPSDNLKVSLFVKSDLACRKMLLQGKILLARGMFEEGIYLVRKASHLADKYELIDVAIAINDTLRSRFTDANAEIAQKLNDKIRRAQETYRDLLKAKELYQALLRMQGSTNGIAAEEQSKEVMDQLVFIMQRARQTGSKRVEFWCKLATMRYCRSVGQFGRAVQHGTEILDLIARVPFLSSNQAAIAVHADLADLFLHEGQYRQAEEHANAARALCSRNDHNELQILASLFKIYFRSNALEKASDTARCIMQHPKLGKYKELQAMWQFYRACLEFTTGRYKDSIKRLNALARVFGNKRQYTLAVKYLELLNILELDDPDWFEYKLEAYRKYISKVDDTSAVWHKAIHRIFLKLLSCNFDYARVMGDDQCLKLFGKIESQHRASWPVELDLINFSSWLHNKAGVQPGPARQP